MRRCVLGLTTLLVSSRGFKEQIILQDVLQHCEGERGSLITLLLFVDEINDESCRLVNYIIELEIGVSGDSFSCSCTSSIP